MNEKRRFFRIQQDVIFNFHTVTTDAVNHLSADQHFDHANALGLFSQFQQFDNDMYPLMALIEQQHSATAQYLALLNQKVNLLSQQMLANESVSVSDSDSGRIDLSQGGLGFSHHAPIGIESWLAIKLVFTPSYSAVIAYAQVTRNQPQIDGSYAIGARFHGLNDEQQRIIAKQIMHTQQQQKHHLHSQVHH